MASAGPFVIIASMNKSCRATFCSALLRFVIETAAEEREAASIATGNAPSIAAPYALTEKAHSGHSASAPPNVEGRPSKRVSTTDMDPVNTKAKADVLQRTLRYHDR